MSFNCKSTVFICNFYLFKKKILFRKFKYTINRDNSKTNENVNHPPGRWDSFSEAIISSTVRSLVLLSSLGSDFRDTDFWEDFIEDLPDFPRLSKGINGKRSNLHY